MLCYSDMTATLVWIRFGVLIRAGMCRPRIYGGVVVGCAGNNPGCVVAEERRLVYGTATTGVYFAAAAVASAPHVSVVGGSSGNNSASSFWVLYADSTQVCDLVLCLLLCSAGDLQQLQLMRARACVGVHSSR
jgi:hypothetical protein